MLNNDTKRWIWASKKCKWFVNNTNTVVIIQSVFGYKHVHALLTRQIVRKSNSKPWTEQAYVNSHRSLEQSMLEESHKET
jgi:hypothetical protein